MTPTTLHGVGWTYKTTTVGKRKNTIHTVISIAAIQVVASATHNDREWEKTQLNNDRMECNTLVKLSKLKTTIEEAQKVLLNITYITHNFRICLNHHPLHKMSLYNYSWKSLQPNSAKVLVPSKLCTLNVQCVMPFAAHANTRINVIRIAL